MVIEPAAIAADTLRAAVRAGLADAVEHLGARSDSFGLPAWRKWARLLTDTRNAKAWPNVFADQRGLVRRAALRLGGRSSRSARTAATCAGSTPTSSTRRPRCSRRRGWPGGGDVPRAGRRDGTTWPSWRCRPTCRSSRRCARSSRRCTRACRRAATPARTEAARRPARLWALRAELDAAPPVEPDFARLSAAVAAIYEAEVAAAALLTG